MDTRLDTPYLALRFGIGLTAALAGADKFFNLLTDWGMYLSPAAAPCCRCRPRQRWPSSASSRSASAWRSYRLDPLRRAGRRGVALGCCRQPRAGRLPRHRRAGRRDGAGGVHARAAGGSTRASRRAPHTRSPRLSFEALFAFSCLRLSSRPPEAIFPFSRGPRLASRPREAIVPSSDARSRPPEATSVPVRPATVAPHEAAGGHDSGGGGRAGDLRPCRGATCAWDVLSRPSARAAHAAARRARGRAARAVFLSAAADEPARGAVRGGPDPTDCRAVVRQRAAAR